MKIIHITGMSPLSPNSGIPAVLKQLTEAQNKICGVESIVLSLKGNVDDIDSSHFYFLGDSSVLSFLNEHKPDVAIIHSFYHAEYIEVARALVKKKIPFYIEPHGSFGHHAMNKSKIKKIIANLTVFRQQIKQSCGYIFTNKAEQEDSVYRTDNDLIIPNGVLPDIVKGSSTKSIATCKNPILYFLGRFDIHHKGLDFLFDALDILEGEGKCLSIRIYGIGNEKQNCFVNRRIKKYRNMHVLNCGIIYGAEKKVALESCNILLLTSRYEGSPMTVLDGFSYGNPCIVTPGTNVSEEAVENDIGWKTELDADSIAKTIIQAIEMYKNDSRGYYERCKKYVLEKYSWDRIAQYSIKKLTNKKVLEVY